jgi:hypothetical protein
LSVFTALLTFSSLQARLMACSQLVRDAFFIIISDPTIIIALSVRLCTHDLFILYHTTGPTSESDFFTWEALICGPKDTPFVIIPILFFSLYFRPFLLKL